MGRKECKPIFVTLLDAVRNHKPNVSNLGSVIHRGIHCGLSTRWRWRRQWWFGTFLLLLFPMSIYTFHKCQVFHRKNLTLRPFGQQGHYFWGRRNGMKWALSKTLETCFIYWHILVWKVHFSRKFGVSFYEHHEDDDDNDNWKERWPFLVWPKQKIHHFNIILSIWRKNMVNWWLYELKGSVVEKKWSIYVLREFRVRERQIGKWHFGWIHVFFVPGSVPSCFYAPLLPLDFWNVRDKGIGQGVRQMERYFHWRQTFC